MPGSPVNSGFLSSPLGKSHTSGASWDTRGADEEKGKGLHECIPSPGTGSCRAQSLPGAHSTGSALITDNNPPQLTLVGPVPCTPTGSSTAQLRSGTQQSAELSQDRNSLFCHIPSTLIPPCLIHPGTTEGLRELGGWERSQISELLQNHQRTQPKLAQELQA